MLTPGQVITSPDGVNGTEIPVGAVVRYTSDRFPDDSGDYEVRLHPHRNAVKVLGEKCIAGFYGPMEILTLPPGYGAEAGNVPTVADLQALLEAERQDRVMAEAMAADAGYDRCLDWLRKGVEVYAPEDDPSDPNAADEGKPLGTVTYWSDSGDPSVGIGPSHGLTFVPREGLGVVPIPTPDAGDELAEAAERMCEVEAWIREQMSAGKADGTLSRLAALRTALTRYLSTRPAKGGAA